MPRGGGRRRRPSRRRARRRSPPGSRARAPARACRWHRTSALSHRHRLSGLEVLDLHARRELLQLLRRAGEKPERSPVRGDAALDADQLECDGCLARAHRVVIADREDGDVRLVDAADQLHVAEHAGVAREVEHGAVLGGDDDAARLSCVRAVRRRARVECIDEGELDAVDIDGAALVEADALGVVDALPAEPAGELDLCEDGRTVLLRDRDGVADVVAVPVRQRDHVRAFRRLLAFRAFRVPVQERIDVDALAARGVDPERRVPEPGECGVCHAASVTMEDRPARGRTFSAMGSRVLPFLLVVGALLADGGGAHRIAYYLVLLAVPAAAAAAFVGVADVLEGKPALTRGITATLSLVLLVIGCAARAGAAEGAAVPAIA